MSALDDMIAEHCVSLKVCEICGRLYCRNVYGSQYCMACEVEMRDYPPIGSRRLRGRKPRATFLAKPLAGVPDEEE